MRKTKSLARAMELVAMLDETFREIRASTKRERMATIALLRAGVSCANDGQNEMWEELGTFYPTLDEADVLVTMANMLANDDGLPSAGYEQISQAAHHGAFGQQDI